MGNYLFLMSYPGFDQEYWLLTKNQPFDEVLQKYVRDVCYTDFGMKMKLIDGAALMVTFGKQQVWADMLGTIPCVELLPNMPIKEALLIPAERAAEVIEAAAETEVIFRERFPDMMEEVDERVKIAIDLINTMESTITQPPESTTSTPTQEQETDPLMELLKFPKGSA